MPKIHLSEKGCRGCMLCVDICPVDVFEFNEEKNLAEVKRPDDCIGCLSCYYACPSQCIEITEVEHIRPFYRIEKNVAFVEQFLQTKPADRELREEELDFAYQEVGILLSAFADAITEILGRGHKSVGRRAGTENVLEIAGLGKACEIAADRLEETAGRMADLRDRLQDGITNALDNVKVNGHKEHRLPNTLSISFYGIEANRLLEEIGLEVAASAGAACHSDTVEISHVLRAMGLDEQWAKGTLRFSTGRMSTEEEIDRAAAVVVEAVKKLRK